MAHHEDHFCRQRPWSNFISEVGSGGGGQLRRTRDLLLPTLIYREIIPHAGIFFYIGRVKNLQFW